MSLYPLVPALAAPAIVLFCQPGRDRMHRIESSPQRKSADTRFRPALSP